MEGEKRAKNGTFNQDPHMIIYGLPDVAIQDKWALLALMGMCWDRRRLGMTMKDLEGPYKLSLREIASITGIKHNALRKTEGKNPRLGVLDRLQNLGYVTVIDARPIDEATGKPGRLQTYLYVHMEKIWTDNLAFCESWHRPSIDSVHDRSLERVVDSNNVHMVNSSETSLIVHMVNSNVHDANSNVHHVNNNGHLVNVTVHGVSSKSPPIHNTSNTLEDKEDVSSSSIEKPSFEKTPIGLGYLEMYLKDFLVEIGQYWNRREHAKRLQQIYSLSRLTDSGSFRSHVDAAIGRARFSDNPLEKFFASLEERISN